MAQTIVRSVNEMVAEAEREIRTISVAEARDLLDDDSVIFVDIRDVRELAKTGRIPGARHVPRGMLEFWIDPASPYYKPFFNEDKTFVFYCAAAGRSALAAKVAQDMGLKPVCHIAGGFTAWAEAEAPIEPPRS